MIIGSNSVSFINYLYHFVIGRMLGPVGYGELVSLLSLMGLLGMIPGAVSLVIIKQISSAKNTYDANSLIAWFKTKTFLFSLAFSFFVLMASPFLTSFLHVSKISYLVLISISFLFSLQSGFNRSILQGLLKFKGMVGSILIENTAKFILSILLVYFGFQIGGVMVALVISSLIGLYITNFYLKYSSANIKFSPDIKSMVAFIVPVTVQSIAITSLYSTDVILVKHFFPAHESGIYAALSTLGKIIFFGAGPISAVMFPLVSQRKAAGQNYKKIFLNSFIATGGLAMIVTIFYWLIPSFAINLLYGGAYTEAASLLVWFGVFMTLFTLSSLLVNFNLSLGRMGVVVIPFIAAFAQIGLIWFYHQNLLNIIFESIFVTALLLAVLLIYSTYGDKLNINNSSRV